MDIRKIEYFIKVAEHLNFSKAAAELHISHQALSKQIQLLEQELGAKLLERTTAKVSLTEVGKKVYDAFLPLMRSMHREYEQIQEFVKYKKDTLRIGYFNGLSYNRVISPIVQHILGEAPELRIDMLATDIGLVKELLYQDSIDFAVSLMFDEKDWQGVSYVPFFDSSLKIIVSEKHVWYAKELVTAEEMAQESMLVYKNRPTEGHESFLHSMRVQKRIPVQNVDTYMGILREGSAFGIVGDIYSRREGNFKLLPLPENYNVKAQVIGAYKNFHPNAKLLQKLQNIGLDSRV